MRRQVETFFKLLFGPQAEGHICLATLTPYTREFKEYYFRYPDELERASGLVEEYGQTENVYFCPQLLASKKRVKATVATCTNIWADLDTCEPANLRVPPSVVVESSPDRYQAYWVLEDRLDPLDAEAIARKVTYFHVFQGADRSGWDLTQMLRVPFTLNLKYDDQPTIKIIEINRNKYRPEDFDTYPQVLKETALAQDFPETLPDLSAQDLLDKYASQLPPHVDILFRTRPEHDWSMPLFNLLMSCLEAGLTAVETYIIAEASACNKFKRDGKDHTYLWGDVMRAQTRFKENLKLLAPAVGEDLPALLSDRERNSIAGYQSFVSEYITWASSLGDAAVQYHQAGAFTILSALLSGTVRLPTSFGTMKPNLWFMLLADTTLTRKTTAMDIAMELLEEVDTSLILATDGSIEGLMTGLSIRPGQPSIFLRDEFSGLLEAISKKDYYAGMAEMLTKLYDGKLQKRVLKKEIIEVKDPVLILFTGGIKNKVCSLLTHEYISSGFIPRFVFITAESDVAKVRPLGPPSEKDTSGRNAMLERVKRIARFYNTETTVVVRDGKMYHQAPAHHVAELTPEAWSRYNQLEDDMMRAALKSDNPDIMTPTYDRLSKSTLKAATLLAASNSEPDKDSRITVALPDLLQAIAFCEQWRDYTNEVILNVGLTRDERMYARVLGSITRLPGISRGKIMQANHLNARSAEVILLTLEQRGQITRMRHGKAELLYPVGNTPRKVVISDGH